MGPREIGALFVFTTIYFHISFGNILLASCENALFRHVSAWCSGSMIDFESIGTGSIPVAGTSLESFELLNSKNCFNKPVQFYTC